MVSLNCKKYECNSPAGIAQSVERQALGREAVGLNLPTIPEGTLGGHSSSSLTIPRCKIGTMTMPGIQSWLWGSLHTSENRAQMMMDPPWLWNPWAESTKVQNRDYQLLHKTTKIFFKIKYECNYASISAWLPGLAQPDHSCPVADPGFGQGGPSSGRPIFADVAEQSCVSDVSICRHGVWGLPQGPRSFWGFHG